MKKKINKYIRNKKGKISPLKIAGMVIAGLFFAAAFALVFSFLVQYLWNNILVALFDIKSISFWQAFGLIILAKIFFGSFGNDCSSKSEEDFTCDDSGDKGQESEFMKDIEGKLSEYDKFWKEKGRDYWEDYCKKLDDKE